MWYSFYILIVLQISFLEFGDNVDKYSLQLLDCSVNNETKKVEVLYQIAECINYKVAYNSYLVKYDLGWSREIFETLSVIAASYVFYKFVTVYYFNFLVYLKLISS